MIYFQTLLLKIRELLWTLNNRELYMLEKLLCSNEEPSSSITQSTKSACQDIPDLEEYVHNFYTGYPNCKEFIIDFYTVTKNTGNNMDEIASDAVQSLNEDSSRVDQSPSRKREEDRDERGKQSNDEETRREDLNISSDGCDNIIMCNSDEKTRQSDGESVDERMQYGCELSDALHDNGRFPRDCDSVSNGENNSESCDSMARSDIVRLDVAGSSTSANNVEGTRNEGNFITPDVTHMLEGCSDNIEIPQTQYLLNQVTRESLVDGEAAHIPDNSLPDLDSKRLISEANKTLSNLLLDSSECQNEISEQTDSGICTVISSENTSLYDKSPEEKKTFANEIQREGCGASDDEVTQENTSYSCSNMNSPKRNNPVISANSCVCSTRSANKAALDNTLEVSSLHSNGRGESDGKNIPRISSNFDGTNEEFIGVAYGNGQLTLCDSNQSTFQINYSENWENLNLNIDASSSKKEFWGDLKCENCPSTSRSIDKIGEKIEKYAQDKAAAKKMRDERQRRRHQHRLADRNTQRTYHGRRDAEKRHLIMRSATSTESSRSNSTDRGLNPRLTGLGVSLHLGQSTRQMPNFGSHSPHMSPRLHHFESRSTPNTGQRCCNLGTHCANRNSSPQSRKLLDHRRSKSEQIAKMKRRDVEKREKHERDKYARTESTKRKRGSGSSGNLMMNDGLGPRTDKSGLVAETAATASTVRHARDNNSQRSARAIKLVNASTRITSETRNSDQSLSYKPNVASSSSCSSCCDSSSETSEFHSDCQDDEEIALAMQAAEIANRNQIRAKFR